MADPSAFAVAANVFAAPNDAFPAIREKSRVWLPLLVLIGGYALVSLIYMNSVDLPWFMEQQIDAQIAMSGNEMTPEERERALEASSNMSPMVVGTIGAVASSVFILVWTFLVALYYTGVSFATGDGVKLKNWFALVCWCALPLVLGLLASLVNILASDARFMLQEDLNPLSFRNLLGIDTSQVGTLERVLASLDLSTAWALALSVLGYQAWTNRPFIKSAGIVLGPLALIVVLGTLIAG
jgi:hypothetical protein